MQAHSPKIKAMLQMLEPITLPSAMPELPSGPQTHHEFRCAGAPGDQRHPDDHGRNTRPAGNGNAAFDQQFRAEVQSDGAADGKQNINKEISH